MKSKIPALFTIMNRLVLTGVLLLLLTLAGALPAAASVTESMTDTSIRMLYEAARTSGTRENILISPDSILTAMNMVENGAAGSTLSEMEKVLGQVPVTTSTRFLSRLHKRLGSTDRFVYKNVNSVWYKKGSIRLKKAYRNRLKKTFGAEVCAAPFTPDTVREMNDWVNRNTNGKIPDIIDRLSEETRVILINAVYFKGAWMDPYVISNTRKFTMADGGTQKVEMFEKTEDEYVEICGAKGYVKPYSGGRTAFMALLPPKGMSVKKYLKQLTGRDFIQGYKNRIRQNVKVYTRVPAFSYDYDITLNEALQRMGIKKAFTSQADLSGMSKDPLRIDQVLHKTHIELTKEGTEAAAATAIVVECSAAYPPRDILKKKVYLNRPFVYAIIDTESGMPVFLGIVNRI